MKKVAFVGVTGWHKNIVDKAYQGFCDHIQTLTDLPWEVEVEFFGVPGALEIPLMAKKCIETKKYEAVACSGFIVDSGIYRHEFVSQTVLDGMMQVSLETGIPVLSAVLTPKTFQENADQTKFFEAHFVKKGQELAVACVESLRNMEKF